MLFDRTIKPPEIGNWDETGSTVSELGRKSAMSEPPGLTYLFGVVSEIYPSNGRAVPGLNDMVS